VLFELKVTVSTESTVDPHVDCQDPIKSALDKVGVDVDGSELEPDPDPDEQL
jgi:hypothetical protein